MKDATRTRGTQALPPGFKAFQFVLQIRSPAIFFLDAVDYGANDGDKRVDVVFKFVVVINAYRGK